MSCYFASNRLEMPMTDEAFDPLWNSFGNILDLERVTNQLHQSKSLKCRMEEAGCRILQQEAKQRDILQT